MLYKKLVKRKQREVDKKKNEKKNGSHVTRFRGASHIQPSAGNQVFLEADLG